MLKKSLVSLAVLFGMLFASVAIASEAENSKSYNGVYASVKGSLAANFIYDEHDSFDTSLLGINFALGYDMYHKQNVPVRLEFEIGILDSGEFTSSRVRLNTGQYTDISYSMFYQTYYFNLYYDFYNMGKFVPYVNVGFGLGRGQVIAEFEGTEIEDSYKTSMGVKIGAGLSYPINEMLKFDCGVHYNYIGQYSSVNFSSFGATAGIRIQF